MNITDSQLKKFKGGSIEIIDFQIYSGIINDISVVSGEITIDIGDLKKIIGGKSIKESTKSIVIDTETFVFHQMGENRLGISQLTIGQNIILTKNGKDKEEK